MRTPTRDFLDRRLKLYRAPWAFAVAGAVGGGAAAALLLGLSGWFLAAAALAGAGGAAVAASFNYLLPAAAMRALAIIRTVGRYGERVGSHEAALRSLGDLRTALFVRIVKASPPRALGLSLGDTSASVIQDVDAVEAGLVQRPAVWASFAVAGVVLIAMAALSWPAALAFLTGLLIQAILLPRVAEQATGGLSRERLDALSALKSAAVVAHDGKADLQVFDLVEKSRDRLMELNGRVGSFQVRLHGREGMVSAIQGVNAGLTVALVMAMAEAEPTPIRAACTLLALAGLEGAAGLIRQSEVRAAFDHAIGRLDRVFVWAPVGPGKRAPSDRPSVEIQGRRFDPPARIALVGPSGAGKTTILEMLAGLVRRPGRDIRLDGVDLAAWEWGSTRRAFALAPQDPKLLSGTLRDNLRLGGRDLSDEQMWTALGDAQVAERFRRSPQGLDTWLGDAGEVLSGGERRRVSLARAFLRDAPWLLLDEPTEGLDAGVEARIVEAIDRRLNETGQGLILVSHRSAPHALCGDRIEIAPAGAGAGKTR